MRRVSETHCNIAYTCSVCGISALGVAGTHSQLCIADYKYRKAAGKKQLLQLVCSSGMHIHISGEFSSQKDTCGQVNSGSAVARHENILFPGVRPTDFSDLGTA